jgi:hypothetical protein
MSNDNSEESKESSEVRVDKWKSDPRLTKTSAEAPRHVPIDLSKEFSRAWSLFICDRCGKRFKSEDELQEHIRKDKCNPQSGAD